MIEVNNVSESDVTPSSVTEMMSECVPVSA